MKQLLVDMHLTEMFMFVYMFVCSSCSLRITLCTLLSLHQRRFLEKSSCVSWYLYVYVQEFLSVHVVRVIKFGWN